MRSPPTIAAVVEGHGEVQAVPILLRRVASEIFGVHYVVLPPPFRVKRQLMTRKAGLANAVAVQAARVGEHGGVLIMADADDDCAVTLADEVRRVAAPTPVEVAVAVREFEAWFLGAVESLRGHRSVRGDAGFGGDPEEPRGAKGVLAAVMTEPYRGDPPPAGVRRVYGSSCRPAAEVVRTPRELCRPDHQTRSTLIEPG